MCVLQVMGESLTLSLYRVRFEEKQIALLKSRVIPFVPFSEADEVLKKVRVHLARFGRRRITRYVFAFHPTLLTTVHSSVLIPRDTPDIAIDESDLEQRLAQGIWRLFDRERARAASKMDTKDIDVALYETRVRTIRLDDHKVVNPIGFKAKVMELHMSHTFAPRVWIEALRGAFPQTQSVFAVEAGVAGAEAIRRNSPESSFLFALLSEVETFLYRVEGNTITYVDTLAWGRRHLTRSISDALALEEVVAQDLFSLYQKGILSARMKRGLEQILMEEAQLFVRGLVFHKDSLMKRIYLHALFTLPEFMFEERFSRRLEDRVKLSLADEGLLGTLLGITLEKPKEEKDRFLELSSLLAFYFLPSDDTIELIARRHARWLMHS